MVNTIKSFINLSFINQFRWGPYFIEPLLAGLEKVGDNEYEPIIRTYDSIGTLQPSKTFEVIGTGSQLLYGCCEALYKPDLGPEELFEVISNCLLSALDRDSLSGWGAYVYILTPTGITVRALKTRQD